MIYNHFPPVLTVLDDTDIFALGKHLHSSRGFAGCWMHRGVYTPRELLELPPPQEEALHQHLTCIVKDISFA